ncbi:NAD(P)/FAD-dependent oxidoreductase [Nibrella saemangeumensis]|uniref:NAD(P)/FAD-dependent oxidoreductase n=1 Tax=Nibrella saemangeumensis TaxID=1084526 RepID=A0ABP8N7I0_9BACT
MTGSNEFDVIIIGGSYAGLSAGMALGRALRRVLIIDSGKPCNRQTPHSHNFLTQDGRTPADISALAKQQVGRYNTVTFFEGLATTGAKTEQGFAVQAQSGQVFYAKKLIFATGITDKLPGIEGFAECWGISVIHCPYCHGYEVKSEKTGILANGDQGFDFSKLINNWTKDLTLFTNGPSTLTVEQTETLKKHSIAIVETEIDRFNHTNGHIQTIVFRDGSKTSVKALYARPPFEQHCDIPQQLGCELTEQGHIKVDTLQRTTIPGVFACGDNAAPMRSVANVVAMGNFSGAVANKELIEEEF